MVDYVVSDEIAATLNGDPEFAETFAAIAWAIDATEKSERVTLLLSTCRNQYLTTNAIFTDLKLAISTGASGSMYESVLRDLRSPKAWDAKGPQSYQDLRMIVRAAFDKRETWAARLQLLDSYRSAVEQMKRPGDRRKASSVFAAPPVRRYPDGDKSDARYLAISLEEDACAGHLETLYRLQEDCWHVLDLVQILLEPALPLQRVRAQENLNTDSLVAVDVEPGPDAGRLLAQVIALIERRDVWQLMQTPDGVILSLTPRLAPRDPAGTILKAADGATSREVFDLLLEGIEAFLRAAREILRDSFEPNIARRPMPEPYVVDLRPHEPIASDATRVVRVHPMPSARSTPPPDLVRVATLHAVIPSGWYNHANEVVYETNAVNVGHITQCVLDALARCAEDDIAALLIPEYFIPRTGLDRVVDAAAEAGILLVAGVEAKLEGGKVVNEVAVWLPDSGSLQFQRKQKPSKFEHDDDYFAHDNRVLLFTNTILGNLGVVVCSDYLEADVLGALTLEADDLVHTIVVCARNPNSGAFNSLATADSIRLYANVLVANSTDRAVLGEPEDFESQSGCILAIPTIKERPSTESQLLDPIAEGLPAPRLLVRELPMGKLRSRSHRGHPEHWMTPPRFASRV